MGLAVTPRLRFLQKYQKQQQLKADQTRDMTHSKPRQNLPTGSESEGSGSEDEDGIPQPLPREDTRFGFDMDDDLDDFLKVKEKVGNVDECVDQERDDMVSVCVSVRARTRVRVCVCMLCKVSNC